MDDGNGITDYTDGVGQTEIASILGRHGDTITVSIAGAGQVSLEVDGEGPDLLDINARERERVALQPPRF